MRIVALKLAVLTAAIAALAIAPAGAAVPSNGKTVGVKVKCIGSAGSTTPGTTPADGVYGPYGTGKPGSVTAAGGCEGTVRLKGKLRGKKVNVGKGIFSLKRGQSKVVVVKLSRKSRRTLRSRGKIGVGVSISSSAALRGPLKLKIKLNKATPKPTPQK